MLTVSFDQNEIDILKKSINHCLETCQNSKGEVCGDCDSLKKILQKLP